MPKTMPFPEVGFMADLTPIDRELLYSYGRFEPFSQGDIFVRQGQAHDQLHLILEGSAEAECCSDVSRVKLGMIRAGESVGEMTILDGTLASATVRAIEDGESWTIHRDRLHDFLIDHPAAGVTIMQNLALLLSRRVRKSSQQLMKSAEGMFGFDYDL